MILRILKGLATIGTFLFPSLCLLSPAFAEPFQTLAPYAILIDADSRTVLFEKSADQLTSPASMAKVMTAEVVFRALTEGRLSPEAEFAVSENAWRKGGGPSGGSAMFAALGSRIKVSDLLQGLIVQSGNDAAIALAEGMAGSEPAFASLMTQRARELDLPKSVFRNASGAGDPAQKTTVRELALLSLHIIQTYPELYKIFGQREFTWNKIRQQNRNSLLFTDIGADGLKTGNIEDAGYGLIASAVQNGQRLVLVVNGLKSAKDRAAEARKLLEWGFRSFELRLLFNAGDTVGEGSVFGGEKTSVALSTKRPVRLLFPKGVSERINAKIVYTGPLLAPIRENVEAARLRVTRGDLIALDLPLYTRDEVATGSLTQRAWDGLCEYGGDVVRRAVTRLSSKQK